MPSACSASGCIASLWMLASGSQEQARTDPRAHRPPCCRNTCRSSVAVDFFSGSDARHIGTMFVIKNHSLAQCVAPLYSTTQALRTRDIHALNNAGFQSARTRGLFYVHSQTAHFSKSRCFASPCWLLQADNLEEHSPAAFRLRSTPLRSVHRQEQRGTLPQSRVPLRFATLRPHFTRSIGRYRSTSTRTFQRTLERLDGAMPARQKPARHKRIKPPFPPPRGIPLSRALAGWSLSLPPLQVQQGVSNRSWGQGLDA